MTRDQGLDEFGVTWSSQITKFAHPLKQHKQHKQMNSINYDVENTVVMIIIDISYHDLSLVWLPIMTLESDALMELAMGWKGECV